MKTIITLAACALLASCVSTTTTTTAPDGTVTVVETRGVDALTVATAAAASTEISRNIRPAEIKATK
jgi:hypothetical protein